jgi:Domain of unknown function (DUF4471)
LKYTRNIDDNDQSNFSVLVFSFVYQVEPYIIYFETVGLYKERYDNRCALFDWDYHNNIKAKASIIHIKQVIVNTEILRRRKLSRPSKSITSISS